MPFMTFTKARLKSNTMKKYLTQLLSFLMITGLFQPERALAKKPFPWQLGFQNAVTPVMESIVGLHEMVLIIIFAVGVFVLSLLLYILIRFNAKRRQEVSKKSHNTFLEIIWTGIPIILLLIIAVPSFKLLYKMDKIVEADLTVKVTGHQWYWSYEYPKLELAFDSVMIEDKNIKEDQVRLLSVDHPLVIPVGARIRVLITSADVLHSWAIPSFGLKTDSIPGRLNETWFKAKKEGIFYGQCSELCGIGHAFMPIAVKVVSKEAFDQWVEEAKTKFALRNDIY